MNLFLQPSPHQNLAYIFMNGVYPLEIDIFSKVELCFTYSYRIYSKSISHVCMHGLIEIENQGHFSIFLYNP